MIQDAKSDGNGSYKDSIFGKNRVVTVRDGELTTEKYIEKCDSIKNDEMVMWCQ